MWVKKTGFDKADILKSVCGVSWYSWLLVRLNGFYSFQVRTYWTLDLQVCEIII